MAPMMKRPAAAAGVDNVPAICKRPSVKLEREPSMTPKVKSEPEVEFPPLPRLQSSPSGTDEMKHGPGSLEELLAWATDAVSTVMAWQPMAAEHQARHLHWYPFLGYEDA